MAFKKPKRPTEQVQKQQLVYRLIAAKRLMPGAGRSERCTTGR